VRLARERGQPPELAQVIERMVRYDAADPALLPEAYTVLGDLDALLYRAWLRNLMRDKDVAVPGRRATVAENERLLAVLTAEGLGNRQLATVLQTSEKSVEGRLSRLFSRTGYRSRVDLAAAMLSGEYES
jgi:DNA-binding NarL/FixJ family response regulator